MQVAKKAKKKLNEDNVQKITDADNALEATLKELDTTLLFAFQRLNKYWWKDKEIKKRDMSFLVLAVLTLVLFCFSNELCPTMDKL